MFDPYIQERCKNNSWIVPGILEGECVIHQPLYGLQFACFNWNYGDTFHINTFVSQSWTSENGPSDSEQL